MSGRFPWSATLAILAALGGGNLWAQCEGHASASTSYTSHTNCGSTSNMLQWSLTLYCYDACGKVWTTRGPQSGTAFGGCSSHLTPVVCTPRFQEYNYVFDLHGQTSAWNVSFRHLTQSCKDESIVITASDCPCAPECEEPDPPPPPPPKDPPPGCLVAPDGTEASVLGLEAARSVGRSALPSGFFSERHERVDGVEFIMEDWAVVSVSRGAFETEESLLLIEATSSPLLSPKRISMARSAAPAETGGPSDLALVVEAPTHPDNSRMIPTPAVELRAVALPYLGERITAAVRIDVGADRKIRKARVLHATGRLPEGLDLEQHLRANLELRYRSEKRHRIIVYGLVDIESGSVGLRESQVVLPLCCCNPICV